MQSSSWAETVEDIKKERDDLTVVVNKLKAEVQQAKCFAEKIRVLEEINLVLNNENSELKGEKIRLQALLESSVEEKRTMAEIYHNASDTFSRTIATLSSGPAPKRARTADEPSSSSSRADEMAVEDVDRRVQVLLGLRDAAHAKAIEELKAKHKEEVVRLRARADEPVNEFRVTKQFHIKEAELKGEVRKLQGQLEAERARSKSMEFAQVERVDEMRTIKELRQRCADRDRLAAEVQTLKDEREKLEEPYRTMDADRLLAMIDVLKEKHAAVVIGMVDGYDAMKKERDEAVKGMKAAISDGQMYKDCLEGKFGLTAASGGTASSSSKQPSGPKMCAPCGKASAARIDALKKKHAEEVAKLQKEVRQWTAKFDARLDASAFAYRFRDREDELRKRIEALERDLTKARNELREKRACFDTHMASTLKHKAIAKDLAAAKEQLASAQARVAELERSVVQVDSVVADLAHKHHAQMLRARRTHAQSRERAARLAAELNAEQLRARMGALFEEDLLFAYRSLRAEYNRDVGRPPSTRRPRRDGGGGEEGGGDWLDGVSDGEPE